MEIFAKVKIGNTKSDLISVKSGLRQGDLMFIILFNLILEKVVRGINIKP